MTAQTDKHIKINGVPNALREACLDLFRTTGGVWELQVQLRTDQRTMPIEDAFEIWPAEESHCLTVGYVRAQPQTAWSEARSQVVDKGLSFSPRHGLAAHQPLGRVTASASRPTI